MSVSREVRFNAYNTRRNLPAISGRKRGEANFLGAFVRSFLHEVVPPSVYGRNFALSGCGIADLLLCRFSAKHLAGEDHEPSVAAFEIKLSDWKRALQQAYRYRYYADTAVVVLPLHRASRALESADVFSALGVALWTFDRSAGVIHKQVTPSQSGALSPGKRCLALSKIEPRIRNLRSSHV